MLMFYLNALWLNSKPLTFVEYCHVFQIRNLILFEVRQNKWFWKTKKKRFLNFRLFNAYDKLIEFINNSRLNENQTVFLCYSHYNTHASTSMLLDWLGVIQFWRETEFRTQVTKKQNCTSQAQFDMHFFYELWWCDTITFYHTLTVGIISIDK